MSMSEKMLIEVNVGYLITDTGKKYYMRVAEKSNEKRTSFGII